MIHLVHAANRHLYQPQLDAMRRAWEPQVWDGVMTAEASALARARYCEDDRALIFMGFDAAGAATVSLIARETRHSSLLDDCLPHLVAACERPVKAPGVFETVAIHRAKASQGAAGYPERLKLSVAVLEALTARSARRFFGFTDMTRMHFLQKVSGLRIRPVGLPTICADSSLLAFEMGVTPADLDAARRSLGVGARQLFEAPPTLEPGVDPLALARRTRDLIALHAARAA